MSPAGWKSLLWGVAGLILAPVFPGSGNGAQVPVGIAALKAEIFSVPVKSADVLLFGANDHLGDLFLPLHKEGKVGSLTAVVPSETGFTQDDLSSWKSYVAGISPGSENAFSLVDGGFSGVVGGLRVRVLPLSAWRGAPEKGPVILDLAFLAAIFKDEVRTPYVELPRTFLAMLDERKVEVSRLVPWIVDRADIPLEHGYLPKLVSAVVREAGSFRERLPAKWQSLRMGEHLAYLALYEQAIAHFDAYLKEEPEEPSVLYRIGFTYFVDGDADRGLRFLHRAWKADPFYIRAYSATAFALFRKGEFDIAERVIRAGLHQDPGFPDLKAGLARVLLAQARKMLRADAAAAEKRFAEIASLGLPEELLGQLRAEWEETKSSLTSPGPPEQAPGHRMGR